MTMSGVTQQEPASSPDTAEGGPGTSPHATLSEQPAASASSAPRKTGKRDRVALACQRCKTRKQKCDGQRPACASCARLSLKCVYIVPLVPAAGEKKLYIKALEQRVAELESALASLGHMGVNADHFGRLARFGSTSTQGSLVPGQPGGSGQPGRNDSDDENDIMLAVRDLSLSASGHYVGATSNITIGRVLSSVVHSQKGGAAVHTEDHNLEGDDPAPKSIYTTGQLSDIGAVPVLTPPIANRLLQGWFRHIHTRYPLLHSARVIHLHENRDHLTEDYDKAIMYLIYAVAGRWLESAGEMGHFFSDQYYDIAFSGMDEILAMRNNQAVDYLLLMALYCTRAPRDPGAWTYVGAAMRLCVELGLHRKQRRQQPSLAGEMNKRRFWTTYFMDRDISIAIGRPPVISDHDIDAEFPIDVEEACLNDEEIRQAALRNQPDIPANPQNSLTSFIHRLRLKKIESEIQHNVYRVDQKTKVPDPVTNAFLDKLYTWRDNIPPEARTFVHQPNLAYEGMEFYTIHYHRCVRFLLYPQLAETPVNMHYLKLCAEACAGIITDYRRLHQVFPVGFSALSIQSVFLAGLTLIYCAWLSPVGYINVEGPLTDCQILLYIVTERYPSARKYRDLYERIKGAILPLISQGKHEPRNPVSIDADMRQRFASLEGSWPQGMGTDLSFMMNHMTGMTGQMTTTPPFDLGFDPATYTGMPTQQQPHQHPQPQAPGPDYNTMWTGYIPNTMGETDAMTGIFQ